MHPYKMYQYRVEWTENGKRKHHTGLHSAKTVKTVISVITKDGATDIIVYRWFRVPLGHALRNNI